MRFPSQAAVQPGNFPPDISRVVLIEVFDGLARFRVNPWLTNTWLIHHFPNTSRTGAINCLSEDCRKNEKKEFTDETRKAQMIPKCCSRESFHLICMKAVHCAT